MIDERTLEQALRVEAASYAVPSGGPDAIVAAAARSQRRRPSRKAWGWTAGLGLATAAVVFVASAGLPHRGTTLGAITHGPARQALLNPAAPGAVPQAGQGVGSNGGTVTGADRGDAAKVVKTGSIEIEVRDGGVSTALARLSAIAAAHRGYVSTSRTDATPDSPSGAVTLRVPVADFEAVVADVSRLGKVRTATTSGTDVTADYADLAARLRALTAARRQFETLLARARTVGEVLAVQSRITDVQTQIEQLQGKQQVLADQAALSSLEVSVNQPGSRSLAGTAPRSGLDRAWHRAVDGFVGGVEGLVGASGTLLYLLLLGAALVLGGRYAWRRGARRML